MIELDKVLKDLYDAAEWVYGDALDRGETVIDDSHDEYDEDDPEKEYRDWAALHEALTRFDTVFVKAKGSQAANIDEHMRVKAREAGDADEIEHRGVSVEMLTKACRALHNSLSVVLECTDTGTLDQEDEWDRPKALEAIDMSFEALARVPRSDSDLEGPVLNGGELEV